MSAAERLVTREGTVWTLRGKSPAGVGLYAPAGVCQCPPQLLVTADELAEHGVRTLLASESAELDVAAQVATLRGLLAPSVPVRQAAEVDPQPLSVARLAEIRSLDLLVMMSDRSAAVVGRALGDLLDEVERLRSRVTELEDAAYGDAEVRLLSPVGQIRHLHQAVAAQMSRAETLDRLCRERQARVAELEALTPATVQTCRVCGAGYTYGQPCSTCEFQARMATEAGPSPEESADLPLDAAASFFQPGRTYRGAYGWKFRCDSITTHPETGERTAIGWRFFRGEWEPYAYHRDDWELGQTVGWTDGTEAGESR